MIAAATTDDRKAAETMRPLARLDRAADQIRLGEPSAAISDLFGYLSEVRSRLAQGDWRQFCSAARSTVLGRILAREPIVATARRARKRDSAHDELLDFIASTPLLWADDPTIGTLHTAIATRPLASAIRARESVLRSSAVDRMRLSVEPFVAAVTAEDIRRGWVMDADARRPADFMFVRGLFDCMGTAEAMRVTRAAASRLRSGGCFLFSSFADACPDAAFVECFFGWRPAWRSEGEMRAIAAAAGSGFAKRHWASAEGAIHYCEVLRP